MIEGVYGYDGTHRRGTFGTVYPSSSAGNNQRKGSCAGDSSERLGRVE